MFGRGMHDKTDWTHYLEIENGTTKVSVDKLMDILEAMDFSITEFFYPGFPGRCEGRTGEVEKGAGEAEKGRRTEKAERHKTRITCSRVRRTAGLVVLVGNPSTVVSCGHLRHLPRVAKRNPRRCSRIGNIKMSPGKRQK